MSPFKVSRRDLEQHWRAADDRALASAAEQLEEFTEETVEVVQAELRRRSSLNLATPAAAEHTNLGESDGDAAALEELKEYTPRIPVTITLVALNLLVFGVMVISGVPLLDPDAETLFNWGGNYAANTLTGGDGDSLLARSYTPARFTWQSTCGCWSRTDRSPSEPTGTSASSFCTCSQVSVHP